MTPRERKTIERIAYRPAEAAELLGVHRSTIYTMMDSGQLPSVSVGRARLISAEVLRAMMGEKEPAAGPHGSPAGVVERTAVEQVAYVVMFERRWRCVLHGERVECAILPSDQGHA